MFSSDSPCSTGWVAYGKSCFLIIDIPSLEWNDARRNCQKLGGDLAKITSAAGNQFICNLIFNQTKTTTLGAWLGLHRKADTKFYWADGSPLTGYTAWSSGEPNSPSTDQKCGHILGQTDCRRTIWNDMSCSMDKPNIERAPVTLCKKTS